ncbi:alpha-crystallin B chain-like isoform X2 [Artemia franciscana]|uniref:alpha-crystallin B chain-like isoform X2 n=1 Tax=Artemia franciscana TaxID=6661 RepID=UPI0032DA246A
MCQGDGGVSLFPVSRPYYYRSPFSGMQDLTYALSRPNKIFDQFFGMPLKAREGTGASELSLEKDRFKISLDAHHFKPEELTVKTTDKVITVEGKHEEKPDEHGRVFRHFKRIYDIPEGVKSEEIRGSISSDGVLIIEGPRKASEDASEKEKVISIQQTNQPALPSHSSKTEESQTKPSLVSQETETTTVNSSEGSSEESG